MMESVAQAFQAFFLPVAKSGLRHGGVNVGCILNAERCSLPRADFSEVFHLSTPCMVRNAFLFFLSR